MVLFFAFSVLVFWPTHNLIAEVQFTDITNNSIKGFQQGGHGAAWADIDQDGDADVYVTMNYYLQEML